MMAYEIGRAPGSFLDCWDHWMERAGAPLYHRLEWLRAVAEESRTSLLPLICRDGDEVVGAWPLFIKKRGLTALFSPPPGCLIASLGPVLRFSEQHQSSKERVLFGSVVAFDSYIMEEIKPDIVQFKTNTALHDVRPFIWTGYTAVPRYSYVLDLTRGANTIFASFKKQVRTDARRAKRYDDIEVITGDRDTFNVICSLIRARYADQNVSWSPSERYLERVYDAFGVTNITTKAVVRDGEIIAGLILLVNGTHVSHWLGGQAYSANYIGLNEMLHWEAIKTFASDSFTEYELVGANTEHLCRHKTKYNPTPELYFEFERASCLGRIALGAMRKASLRKLVSNIAR